MKVAITGASGHLGNNLINYLNSQDISVRILTHKKKAQNLGNKIEIYSDGSPWRPVVHVQDVCSAILATIKAPPNVVNGESFNLGISNGNFRVKDLAIQVQNSVKGSELVFLNKEFDPRSYKVSFNKIFNELVDYYKPKWDLKKGAEELINFFQEIKFNNDIFKSRYCIRLKQLQYLTKNNYIDKSLRWVV